MKRFVVAGGETWASPGGFLVLDHRLTVITGQRQPGTELCCEGLLIAEIVSWDVAQTNFTFSCLLRVTIVDRLSNTIPSWWLPLNTLHSPQLEHDTWCCSWDNIGTNRRVLVVVHTAQLRKECVCSLHYAFDGQCTCRCRCRCLTLAVNRIKLWSFLVEWMSLGSWVKNTHWHDMME